MDKYILAIDLGTTNLKSFIFNKELGEIASASLNYPLEVNGCFVEFDADRYWVKCKDIIKKAINKSGIEPEEIISISVSSQAEPMVVVDRDGHPLRKAISHLDSRSGEECRIISSEFDHYESYKITGQP